MRTVILAIASLALAAPVQAQSLSDLLKTVEGAVGALGGTNKERSSSNSAGHIGPRYDVETFKIAGLHLGMTGQDAVKSLKERGFTDDFSTTSWHTFASDVTTEAQRLRQPVPEVREVPAYNNITATDKFGNVVYVDFTNLVDGSYISSIKMRFNADTNDLDALPADLVSRYGEPTRNYRAPRRTYWCDNEARNCSDGPFMSSQFMAFEWLELSDAGKLSELRKAQMASYFTDPTADRQRSLLGS